MRTVTMGITELRLWSFVLSPLPLSLFVRVNMWILPEIVEVSCYLIVYQTLLQYRLVCQVAASSFNGLVTVKPNGIANSALRGNSLR